MGGKELVVSFASGSLERGVVERGGISTHIVVVSEAGGRGDQDENGARTANMNLLAIALQGAAVSGDLDTGLKFQGALDSLSGTIAPFEDEDVIPFRPTHGLLRAQQTKGE